MLCTIVQHSAACFVIYFTEQVSLTGNETTYGKVNTQCPRRGHATD